MKAHRAMLGVLLAALGIPLAAQCVDYSKDPAGCQPSTFDTPIGQMPSVRVGRDGKIDPFSSEADARAGAAKLEKIFISFGIWSNCTGYSPCLRKRTPRAPGRAGTWMHPAMVAAWGSPATASSPA